MFNLQAMPSPITWGGQGTGTTPADATRVIDDAGTLVTDDEGTTLTDQ